MLVEFFGQARPGVGTGHEIRYQATTAAHGDPISQVVNLRVALTEDSSTQIRDH
jgi:hypothetical protein